MVMTMLKVDWMLWSFGYEKNVKIWAVGSLWKKHNESQHLVCDETKDTSEIVDKQIDDNMQKELDELRNLRKIEEEGKNRLTDELAALQEKLSKLQNSEGALVKLQSELEASEKRSLDLEKERGELEEKLRLLERNAVELESLQEKLHMLEQERDELAQKLKEQMKQYEEMRSDLEKERDSFGKERDEFKNERDELIRKYEALQNENIEEKRKHAAEVARLRENLQSTMQEKDMLAQKLKEESDVNRSNSINLKKERDDLKEMIEMLENFKKIEEKEKKRLHEEIDCLRGVLQIMKQDKESRDVLHKNLLDEKV